MTDEEMKLVDDLVRQALRSAEWRKTVEGFDLAIQSKVAFAMSKTLGYGIRAGMDLARKTDADQKAETSPEK